MTATLTLKAGLLLLLILFLLFLHQQVSLQFKQLIENFIIISMHLVDTFPFVLLYLLDPAHTSSLIDNVIARIDNYLGDALPYLLQKLCFFVIFIISLQQ